MREGFNNSTGRKSTPKHDSLPFCNIGFVSFNTYGVNSIQVSALIPGFLSTLLPPFQMMQLLIYPIQSRKEERLSTAL